jgi:hypothetical protein
MRLEKRLFHIKGHGNEADFLGVLHKSVRNRSLTLLFELFRFWLRIRGDIRNRTTPRLVEPQNPRKSASLPCPFNKLVLRRNSNSYIQQSFWPFKSDGSRVQNVSWLGKSASPGRRRGGGTATRNRKISEASSVSSVVSASSG